ncbi:MAG: acetyl ornithine aminotransferase family protein [Methanomassiliicoccales archaeon]|nr:acetyl ornithine aminotransferase family protein [Methanomassiliicoccales archaeon]
MTKIPVINTELPGPKAKLIIENDEKYLATSTKALPLAIEAGYGSTVIDVDGNKFLDFTSGVAVLNLGHRHPAVVKAIKEQVDKFIHFAGTDFYYEVQSRLAKKLTELTPGGFDKKVFFSNSGTESIEAAMKIAKWSMHKSQFIAFIGAFHGRTMGSLSLTASKPVQRARYFPVVPGVIHIPYAYCYRCPYRLEYPSCDIWCARGLEEVYFESFIPSNEVAAIFMEPIQGEGGYIVPPSEFVKIIHGISRKYGILFVDDEVQAGMARTGKMWGIEHHGVVPDIVCSSKALGSGIPIGATIFDEKLDFSEKGAHSNTFGGNPIACAAALATLEVIDKENLVEKARKNGQYLRKRLEELKEKYEIIGDVRGIGMMQATEFVRNRETKEPASAERDRIIEIAFKNGLILLGCGKSSIRYIPPLTTTIEEIDTGIEILEQSIATVEKMKK